MCDGNACPMLWFSSIITTILVIMGSGCRDADMVTMLLIAAPIGTDLTATEVSTRPIDTLTKIRRHTSSARRMFDPLVGSDGTTIELALRRSALSRLVGHRFQELPEFGPRLLS